MTAVPKLTYRDVAAKASDFINQYHPSLELPVPIEEIIDVKMGLDIVPFPRLYKDHGLNGFLSHDRTAIYVDEYQAEQFNEKYRYTLAHELGHYVLHKSVYEEISFKSPDEYVKWRLSIPKEDIGWYETQGDWFAGLVLVPTSRLEQICTEIFTKYKSKFPPEIIFSEDFWSYASNEISLVFEVNPPVVEIQIRKERIIDKLRSTMEI